MEIIVVVVMAFVIGWKLSQAWHLLGFRKILEALKISNRDLDRLAKDAGIDLAQEPPKPQVDSDMPTLEVRIEQTDLGLFAYRKDNSLYLARGEDREELMRNLVNNLTNVRVIVSKEDGADLISP
jgi:hypothetical protein